MLPLRAKETVQRLQSLGHCASLIAELSLWTFAPIFFKTKELPLVAVPPEGQLGPR